VLICISILILHVYVMACVGGDKGGCNSNLLLCAAVCCSVFAVYCRLRAATVTADPRCYSSPTMNCSLLQCVAFCCSMLQKVAACSSVLQCVAVFCSMP